MANRFLTHEEELSRIVAPLLLAMAEDLEKLPSGTETRISLMGGLVPVVAVSSPGVISGLRSLAAEITAGGQA